MQNTEMHDIEMDLKEQMATADENFRKREEEFQELDAEQRVKIEQLEKTAVEQSYQLQEMSGSKKSAEEKVKALQAQIDKMNLENLEVEAQFKEWNKSFEKERLTK